MINDFFDNGTYYVCNGEIIYNGRDVSRWEAREDTRDGNCTYTAGMFLVNGLRPTRRDVIEAYREYQGP